MLMVSAQTAFKKSRTFEFDNKVIETTDALKEEYLIDSFVKVRDMRVRHMMVHGTSDMYSSFKGFMNQAKINNKSYIIILSDCRDWAGPKVNGIPASVELVEEMAREAKKQLREAKKKERRKEIEERKAKIRAHFSDVKNKFKR